MGTASRARRGLRRDTRSSGPRRRRARLRPAGSNRRPRSVAGHVVGRRPPGSATPAIRPRARSPDSVQGTTRGAPRRGPPVGYAQSIPGLGLSGMAPLQGNSKRSRRSRMRILRASSPSISRRLRCQACPLPCQPARSPMRTIVSKGSHYVLCFIGRISNNVRICPGSCGVQARDACSTALKAKISPPKMEGSTAATFLAAADTDRISDFPVIP